MIDYWGNNYSLVGLVGTSQSDRKYVADLLSDRSPVCIVNISHDGKSLLVYGADADDEQH
jgi:hypothetical protein